MGSKKTTILCVVLGVAVVALPQVASASEQPPVVKSGVVDVGTAKLAYDEAGEGDAIVMIHGRLWSRFVAEFAEMGVEGES